MHYPLYPQHLLPPKTEVLPSLDLYQLTNQNKTSKQSKPINKICQTPIETKRTTHPNQFEDQKMRN
jgi:hypothetical protein